MFTTWAVFFLGRALGATPAGPGYPGLVPDLAIGHVLEATAHGIGQVMFQGSVWTGILFLVGIAGLAGGLGSHGAANAVPAAFDASLALEFMGFAGPDVREGVASLRERRPPSYGPTA